MKRRFGTFLVVAGLLVLAYAAAVLFWRDPVTDLYNRYEQHRLAAELDEEFGAWRPLTEPGPSLASRRDAVAREAHRFAGRVREGQALGRIEIPSIGVRAVFVQGTRWAQDLSRGPGHY